MTYGKAHGLSTISKPKIDVPDWTCKEGISLGEITVKGKTSTVYIPTRVHETFCLPHFGFGPQGVGKPLGMGVNTAVGAIEAGYSAFLLDVAAGDLVTETRMQCPNGCLMITSSIWTLDTNSMPSATWSELAYAGESGDEDNAASAGNRLSSQLVAFIDTMAKSQLRTG